MNRKTRRTQQSEELNIWRGFTDLMSNAFMIMSFLFILAIIPSISFQKVSDKNQNQSQQKIRDLTIINKQLKIDYQKLAQENEDLKNKPKITGQSPPLFIISDSDRDENGHSLRFELGSAELPEALSDYIKNKIVKEIKNNEDQYKTYIIQVIGHTDSQKIIGKTSNLDVNLQRVANNSNPESMRNLQAGSNTDLGLMRALAVAKMLQQKENLQNWKIQAYSAAQLYNADGNYAQAESGNNKDDPARRRVEIRFTPPAEEKKL